MVWRVERARATTRDLAAIIEFLTEAALDFGEPPDAALARAEARIAAIEAAVQRLAEAPYQGTLCPELGPGLRRVTKGRAIFYFDLDEDRQVVRLLAVFYGGQDHRRRMLIRLLSGG